MKQIWFVGFIALTMALMGCEEESSTTPEKSNATARLATQTGHRMKVIPVDQLPTSVQSYLQNHYPGATIRRGGQGPRGNYGVLVAQNGTEKAVFFKSDGTFKADRELKRQSLKPVELPEKVTGYLQKQYAGSVVKRATKGPHGNYIVAIQTSETIQILLFDPSGTFRQEWKPGESGQILKLSELPASLTSYINSHYSDAKIQGAGQGPRGNFLVVVEQQNARKLLIFSQSGSFVRELSR